MPAMDLTCREGVGRAHPAVVPSKSGLAAATVGDVVGTRHGGANGGLGTGEAAGAGLVLVASW
jgi:hypothetical protein